MQRAAAGGGVTHTHIQTCTHLHVKRKLECLPPYRSDACQDWMCIFVRHFRQFQLQRQRRRSRDGKVRAQTPTYICVRVYVGTVSAAGGRSAHRDCYKFLTFDFFVLYLLNTLYITHTYPLQPTDVALKSRRMGWWVMFGIWLVVLHLMPSMRGYLRA